MDPDTNLKEQLERAQKIINNEVDPHNMADIEIELAELVLALNEWVTKGGCLPKAWTK